MAGVQAGTTALLSEYFAARAFPSAQDTDMRAIAKIPSLPSTASKLHTASSNDIGVGTNYDADTATTGTLSNSIHSSVEIPVTWYESKKITSPWNRENFASYNSLAADVMEVAKRTKSDYIKYVLQNICPVSADVNNQPNRYQPSENALVKKAGGTLVTPKGSDEAKQVNYSDIVETSRELMDEVKFSNTSPGQFVIVVPSTTWQILSSDANFTRYDSWGANGWRDGFMGNLNGVQVVVSHNLPWAAKTSPSGTDTYEIGRSAGTDPGPKSTTRQIAIMYYAPYCAKTSFNPMLKIDTRDILRSGTDLMGCGGMGAGIAHGTINPVRLLVLDD